MILNSLDFGVPQDRERAFIVSHLGAKLDIKDKIEKNLEIMSSMISSELTMAMQY